MTAARSMSSPTTADLANAKRILRYLKKQPGLELIHKRDSKFELTCYSDASYASTAGYKSVTGSMAFLSGGLVFFNSQTQRNIAQSTSESEIIAMNSVAKHGVHFASMRGELGWDKLRTFKLLTDNRSALSLVPHGNYFSRSKHIAVRYATLRQWVQEGRLHLDFAASSRMLSGICIKYCVRETQDSIIRQISDFK